MNSTETAFSDIVIAGVHWQQTFQIFSHVVSHSCTNNTMLQLTEPFIPVEYGQYTNASGHKLSVANLPNNNGKAINPSHSRLHSQVYEIDTFTFE